MPAEVHARLEAIEAEIGALTDRPLIFDETDIVHGGAFVSVDYDGTVRIDRGFVRPEDEPIVEEADAADGGDEGGERQEGHAHAAEPDAAAGPGAGGEDAEEEGLKPLPERLQQRRSTFACCDQAKFAING